MQSTGSIDQIHPEQPDPRKKFSRYVIVNQFIKMIHYELVKIIIDVSILAEVIIEVVMWHHGLLNSIVSDWNSVFTSKFWFLLCYFLGIKQKLSIAFHLQTDGQTER